MLKICWRRDQPHRTQLDLPGGQDRRASETSGTEELRASHDHRLQDTLANRERCKQCRPTRSLPCRLMRPLSPSGAAIPQYRAPEELPYPLPSPSKANSRIRRSSSGGKYQRQRHAHHAKEPLAKGDGSFSRSFCGGAHVSGYGEITRVDRLTASDGFLYGIKFTNIAPSVKSAIEAAVKK